jgi:RNA polymerase sigma-70 factor (ECF subfamily)
MSMPIFESAAGPNTGAQFPSTLWSMVRSARDGESTVALERLCRAYWAPLYAYVRRQGYSPQDAQDMTQEFFSRLLEDHSLAAVHESKGRFRSFLLASIKHLLANEWKRANRQKRGGGQIHFSLDAELAEGRHHLEPPDHLDPEKVYEKRWVETLLQCVLDRLRGEWEQKDMARDFDELKPFLVGKQAGGSFADAAARAGVTEASLKWTVHKLRQRYRELVREEIAQTVNTADEIEDEIRHLFAVLAG